MGRTKKTTNNVTYTVEYYLDGTKLGELTQTCERGKAYPYAPLPAKDKYKVEGWYKAEDYKGLSTDGTKKTQFKNLGNKDKPVVKLYAKSHIVFEEFIEKEDESDKKDKKKTDGLFIARKIQIVPVGSKEEVKYVWDYIREGTIAQNMAKNQYISALYVAMVKDMTENDRKELNRLFSRMPNTKKDSGSAYDEFLKLPIGLPSASTLADYVKKDFKTAMKRGLKYGCRSLPTYRKDNPLHVHGDYVCLRETNPHKDFGLYHTYSSYQEFCDNLYSDDLKVYIKFAAGITFQFVFGKAKKSTELRSVIGKIFDSTYDVCGSSISIEHGKMILNLSIRIPVKDVELDPDIVVGVNAGLYHPAFCALNINDKNFTEIGSIDAFVHERQKIQAMRRRAQKSLAYSSGGHGRGKKLKTLDRFKKQEKSWNKTQNHLFSKKIVDFALENKAAYINIEDLEGYFKKLDEKAARKEGGETSKEFKKRMFLREWTYYQLQSFIKYKAAKYGIQVRYVDPAYDSQTCSYCGHFEEGQRISRKEFVCKNPKCKKCGVTIDADFNAARNVSMMTTFVKVSDDADNG